MIRYSCDRCKRELDPHRDTRYVVQLEMHPQMEPLDADEFDDDRDYLSEIQDILEQVELDDQDDPAEGYQKQRYDLCAECSREFMRNPMGRELAAMSFSDN